MPFKEIDVEELYNDDEKLIREEVQTLMQWSGKQAHLPEITELQLALFLHSCYYKQEAAKTAIDTYFTVKTLCPDIFLTRTFKDPLLKAAIEFNVVAPLPMPNGDLLIYGIVDSNAENCNIQSQVKMFDAGLMIHLHQNGPVNGLHILIDMKGIGLGHIIKFSAAILVFKKFFYLLQEGMPVRLKHIHMVNNVFIMDKLLAIFKPFLKKEVVDALVLHTDVETIFNYIPKHVLPEHFGGSAGSVKELQEKVKILLTENEDLLEFQDKQLVDESKRTRTLKNLNDIFGVEGSFKKLQVD